MNKKNKSIPGLKPGWLFGLIKVAINSIPKNRSYSIKNGKIVSRKLTEEEIEEMDNEINGI